MKYITYYDNYKPIKVNSYKPFKVKENLPKSIQFLQKRIKSIKKRLQDNNKIQNRSKLNNDLNDNIRKLSDLTRYQIRQAEYLKNNPIVENIDNESENNGLNLIELIKSHNFEADDILDYIGIDNGLYDLPDLNYFSRINLSVNGFTLLINFNILEDIMNIEQGIFQHILSYSSNFDCPEYDIYIEDLHDIHILLTTENLNKIKKLAKIFNYNIDVNEQEEIVIFFNKLSLVEELNIIKDSISREYENAMIKSAKKLLDSIPFDIDYYRNRTHHNKEAEIYIDYDIMINFLKKHNKTNIKTIKEFLEVVSNNFYFYYSYLDEDKEKYLNEYDILNNDVSNILDELIKNPDHILLKMIRYDNLESFKKYIELANFNNKYQYDYYYDIGKVYLVEIAILYNNSISNWMCTKEFKNILKKKVSKHIYDILIDKITNYSVQISSQKYNL